MPCFHSARNTYTARAVNFPSVTESIVFALMAQIIWGVFPIYLKLLAPTPAIDIVAHRASWAYVLLILFTFVGSLVRFNGWPRERWM